MTTLEPDAIVLDTQNSTGLLALLDPIASHVQHTPNAIAICDIAIVWTYEAMWQCVEQTTNRLIEAGLQPGDTVMCIADRSSWTVIALLAIWRAGGVYVPVMADYPRARIDTIRDETQARLMIEYDKTHKSAGHFHITPACAAALNNTERPPSSTSFNDGLAYVIYTSGSSGQPKGVAVDHLALRNVIEDHIRVFEITSADRVLQFSSPAFDAALFQILMPLYTGATLVLVDDATLSEVSLLLARIEAERVTVVSLPPAYLARFARRHLPSCVRLLNTGGDAPVASDARHYAAQCTYFSTYGPTEATICCAYHRVDPQRDYAQGVPIGAPVANMRLAILDQHRQPVSEGETGELYVSGIGLARGYIGATRDTSDAFVELSFNEAAPSSPHCARVRWYRTGDLARLHQGDIYFAGRADRQVKVNGYRVELSEIERALERHAAVRRAVLELVADRYGRATRLRAYLQGNARTPTTDIRAHLAQTLPTYMLPAEMVWVNELALTPNGKIDMRALSEVLSSDDLDDASNSDLNTHAALHTSFQRNVAAIWERLLDIKGVGLDSDFFALGGDSLIAMSVACEVARTYQCDTRMADLFRAPVFKDYVALLEKYQQHNVDTDDIDIAIDIQPAPVNPDFFPLTPAQRRLWTLQHIEPHSGAYHLAHLFFIHGAIDVKRLTRAFESVVERHAALRTAFIVRHQTAYQRIIDIEAHQISVEEHDFLVRYPKHSPLEEALAYARERAAHPFDLTAGNLSRLELLKIAPERYLLFFVVHHIVCDGASLGIVLNELGHAYRALGKTETLTWPCDAPAYCAVLDAQTHHLQKRLATLASFWRSRIEPAPATLSLPADFARPAKRSSSGNTLRFTWDAHVLAALTHSARSHGVSKFTFLLTLIFVLLHRYTEEEDLIIGIPVTERFNPLLNRAVGMFVNTVIVRAHVTAQLSFRALLHAIHQECSLIYAHSDYPFDLLVEQAHMRNDPAHNALFNVMAAWQNADDTAFSFGEDLTIERHLAVDVGSKFDLSFDFVEREHGLDVLLEYSDALFLRERIERIFQHLSTLLQAALFQPEHTLSQLTLLDQPELDMLQKTFQAPRLAGPATPMHACDYFSAAAARTPDHTAIIYGNRQLTYAQVERHVNALAAFIIEKTAGAQAQLIGVLVERSERFFITVLAIWKASHAYVPLDPLYPAQRIAYIIEASKCTLIVADKQLVERINIKNIAHVALIDYEASHKQLDGSSFTNAEQRTRQNDFDQPAYCYFTSGSTGTPKGVLVSHRSVSNAIEVWRHDYQLQQPRVLQLAGHAFDVALGDLCRSLFIGGALVIADEIERIDAPALTHLINKHHIDCCEITPSLARLLTQYWRERAAPACLTLLIVGSDVWTLDEFVALRSRLADTTRLLNSYGTTEATIDSTFFEPDFACLKNYPAHVLTGERVPIGKPLSNVELLICDRAAHLMPIGVPGELCIAGPAVAMGYLGLPSCDGERFVTHPLRAGERMFRTRDRAAWRADGTIALFGRSDDQIKVRGYRIDRIEIEQALRTIAQVDQAVVAVHSSAQRLMAFITLRSDNDMNALKDNQDTLTLESIRAHVAEQLPFFAIPDTITVLDAMPLNVNGKVSVKALEALEARESSTNKALFDATPLQHLDQPTLSPREALLAQLWHEVLREPVVIEKTSSFFGLGGDSLLAVALVIAAHRVDATLTLADIYRHPRLTEMASCLVAGHAIENTPLVLAEVDAALRQRYACLAQDMYPATSMQAAMLNWSQCNETCYLNQSSWRLRGAHLTLDALRAIVLAVAHRYPCLRTAFIFIQDNEIIKHYYQIVLPALNVPIVSEDLSSLSCTEQDTRIAQRLHTDQNTPFSMGEPLCPTSRVMLFERAPGDIELVWTLHHAVEDGWSHTQIEACFMSYCSKLAQGEPLPNEPIDTTYREFVALDHNNATATALIEYWTHKAHVFPQPSPSNKKGHTCGPISINQHYVPLDAASIALLKHRARAFGVSLKSLFLTAFHRALYARENHAPVIGIVSNGRSARLSNPFGMVGLCWNIVPFYWPHAKLGVQQAFDELSHIESHASLPLPVILQLARNTEQEPLDACLNYTDFHPHDSPGTHAIEVVARDQWGHFHFPITLNVALHTRASHAMLVIETDSRHFSEAEQTTLRNVLLMELHQ